MGEEKKEAVSRRKYLGAVGGLAITTVAGWAVAGYLASRPPAVEKVTETKTVTVTVTATPTPTPKPTAKKVDVAFWVGNLASPYWISCKDGAEKAAKDVNDYFGKEMLTVTTFDAVDDPARQSDQIESVIGAKKYNAAVLPAVVAEAMVPAFKKLYDAGIPTITYDREIAPAGQQYRLFVIITNNVEAGALETESVIEFLEKSGKPKPWKIAVNCGHPGASSAEDRKSGHHLILDPLVKKGEVTIVNEQYHEGWKRELARATIEGVLSKHHDLAAVVCSNDDMALGSIAAVKGAGLKPGVDVIISGFDAISEAVEAVRKGEMNVTIGQAAKIMAYWGAYAAFLNVNLKWMPPVKSIPAPVVPVTTENVETFAPLMEPPRWDLWSKYGPELSAAFPKA